MAISNSKYCEKQCDMRRAKRAPYRDKVVKRNKNNAVEIEVLGFNCSNCGKGWLQTIDYTKAPRKRITWKRV